MSQVSEIVNSHYDQCIYSQMVLFQGAFAQSTRVKRRRRSTISPGDQSCRGQIPSFVSPSIDSKLNAVERQSGYMSDSTCVSDTANCTAVSSYAQPTAARISYQKTPLLPTRPMTASERRIDRGFNEPNGVGSRLSSPPNINLVPSRASINPRFYDAEVEYIGKDCVIHNGIQTVDISVEFATQRAAPRLVVIKNTQ